MFVVGIFSNSESKMLFLIIFDFVRNGSLVVKKKTTTNKQDKVPF